MADVADDSARSVGLAIELTSSNAALALTRGGRVDDVYVLPTGRRNSGLVVAAAAELCTRNGLHARDLGALFVSVGPGGFTGTRVAVTFAKFLSAVGGACVVPVFTPDVIVQRVTPAGEACVVLDARRGSVYAATYTAAAGVWRRREVLGLITASALVDRLPADVLFTGEGLAYHATAFVGRRMFDGDPLPDVRDVALLGSAGLLRGKTVHPAALLPAYVRIPEAEEKRLAAT